MFSERKFNQSVIILKVALKDRLWVFNILKLSFTLEEEEEEEDHYTTMPWMSAGTERLLSGDAEMNAL